MEAGGLALVLRGHLVAVSKSRATTQSRSKAHLGEAIRPVLRKLTVHHRALELRSELRLLLLVLLTVI